MLYFIFTTNMGIEQELRDRLFYRVSIASYLISFLNNKKHYFDILFSDTSEEGQLYFVCIQEYFLFTKYNMEYLLPKH